MIVNCSWRSVSMPVGFLSLVCLLSLQAGLFAPTWVHAAEPPLVSIDQRFAGDGLPPNDTPSFQRHISPLLGRLGCNGRACHGSFQGRGDFQLSLFGYDFQADLKALLEADRGRVVPGKPDESLIVNKPIDASLHEGGKRFEKNGWEDRVLRSWIQHVDRTPRLEKLTRLEIIPAEITLTDQSETIPLKAIATWEDGTREDVTPLCRFQSNDTNLVTVDDVGRVTPGSSHGDSHIVVYYDKGVTPVPVLRPVTNLTGKNYPRPATATELDRLVVDKLAKLGVLPSPLCDDLTFLRRVSLSLAGTLPSESQIRDYLAIPAATRRQQWVEKLLQSEAYAAWWTTQFCDWTGNNTTQLQNAVPTQTASELWYEWIYKRIADNVPYDEIVEGMVLAQSREDGESYLDFCVSMSESCRSPEKFAERNGMTMYWARNDFRSPDQRAIGFAHAFLGVRIQCAQCHKHPFDQWSKEDFASFAKIFSQVQLNPNGIDPKQWTEEDRKQFAQIVEPLGLKDLRNNEARKKLAEAVRDGETVPFAQLTVRTTKPAPKPNAKKQINKAEKKGKADSRQTLASGQFLGGGTVTLEVDARTDLMNWLRAKNNPYFATALVNRVWASYFGRGIVDAPDDLNLANPPSNGPLLHYLANGFIENDYDLQWLHRTIVLSDTYQRSWETNESNARDLNFSHYLPHRLPAEVLYDSIAIATGNDAFQQSFLASRNGRAINVADTDARRNRSEFNYAFNVFGRSTRKSNCDCDRSDAPSVLQTIYMRNDKDVLMSLNRKESWLLQVTGAPSNDRDVDKKKTRIRNQELTRLQKITEAIARLEKAPNQENALQEMRAKEQKIRTSLGLEPNASIPLSKPEEPTPPSIWSDQEIQAIIEQAYLRTLTRYPTEDEQQISQPFIRNAKSQADGLEGLLWALLNTKEFTLSH